MKAKKKYGQHFLIDNLAISSIGEAVINASAGCKRIVEVGPGKGALTKEIINRDREIKLIEIDQDMVRVLKQSYNIGSDQIINKNILEVNPYDIFNGAPFVLAGNYPYNISSQILFWMLSAQEIIPAMIGMYQKEVAERVCAKEGNKKYGILSVLVQVKYDVKIIIDLEPEAFSPPPKVKSAVIICTSREKSIAKHNYKTLRRVVKTTFNHRRKMISTTLKHIVSDRSILEGEIFSKRPEHISVEGFVELANFLEDYIV